MRSSASVRNGSPRSSAARAARSRPSASRGLPYSRPMRASWGCSFPPFLGTPTEVGEVSEADAGGSSTMPHKRNPVGATLARACAELATAHAGVLERALVGEHERAAGVWQAEPAALSGALAYAGGALHALAG